jgi:Transposase DDE domain group 1
MPDRRDASRVRHAMFERVMARVCAIACGHEDAIDLDRLRHDPLMKVAVGGCPQSRAPLPRNRPVVWRMPRKTEATRLTAALVDQAGATIRPRKQEILDIDDAPGGDPSIVPE